MDHISNLLNFSTANHDGDNTPPDDMNISRGIPTFDDLPLASTQKSPEKENSNTGQPQQVQTEDQVSAKSSELNIPDLKKRLYTLKDEISSIIRLLETGTTAPELSSNTSRPKPTQTEGSQIMTPSGEQIIEGVFTGEKMRGPDGHEYVVPPNYASKSKLVEGDRMKLTITNYGKFIYKQIGPIERKRIIGVLQFDEATQMWSVVHEGNTYKILTASATFYHGKPGDHVVILVPKDMACSWGAVENIIAS